MIKIENVSFKYKESKMILNNLSFQINEGEIVAIVGKNGSGKSTIGKLMSGILKLKNGRILIDDIDISKSRNIEEINNKIGIVFQNPENQIIFNNVHDDMVFALDNLGIEDKEERIKEALKQVQMEEYLENDTYELSLGQKQRVTIAGVLSIKPKYIVMDEPTAMLDPEGKEEIRKIVKELKELGYTIIYITNIIDEIFISDRVVILEKGSIIKEFKTKDILENIEFLKDHNITIPKIVELMEELKKNNIDIDINDFI